MTRTAVVATSNGPVCGQINNGIQTFKGLRYGAPTGGANRFLPPRKPTPWAKVADATAYGNSAVQGNIPGMDLSKDAPSMRLNGADVENKVASEDCLFLNVW
ncbi:MAG: carboxylesterase family protein, partial [Sphingobium sp.]